jgi:hypothetical protein
MPIVPDYQLAHRFDEICRRLNAEAPPQQRQVPLGYWTVPKDRRLPRALLAHATSDIIQTSFARLADTPGIGVKKLATLVVLLERALSAAQNGAAPNSQLIGSPVPQPIRALGSADFDAAAVTELEWAEWRESVKRHGLGRAPLGRFAISLQELPRVTWHKLLGDYADLTLQQLRKRKTHGEKRVRSVIEVFAMAHALLGGRPPTHLSVRIVPGFAMPVEAWLLAAAKRQAIGSVREVAQAFAQPLVHQLRHDAGDVVADIVEERLRLGPVEFSASKAATQRGLTRARVYQLLAESALVMSVRWPEGGNLVHVLRQRALSAKPLGRGASLFLSAADVFYPRRAVTTRLGANGSISVSRGGRASRESKDEEEGAAAA